MREVWCGGSVVLMENLNNEEFFKTAKERFGDKIYCGKINIKDPDTMKYLGYSEDAIKSYPEQAWVLDNSKCPNCNAELLGLFGSFQWDLTHGYGHCDNCNKVEFKYYHYIEDKKPALRAFVVSGF